METLRKAVVVVEYYIRSHWKYRLNAITWDLVVPIASIISAYLTGAFVKKINFYGQVIPYFQFILFSLPFVWMFFGTIWTVGWAFVVRNPEDAKGEILRLLYSGIRGYLIYSLLWEMYYNGFRGTLMLLVGYLLFSFPIKYFLLALFLLILTELYALALSFILSSIALLIRREAESVLHNVEWILGFVISEYFSIMVLPESIRNILLYFVPFAWFLEIIRKYFIFGILQSYDLIIIFKSFVINVLQLLLGIFIFSFVFNYARRKGLVKMV